MDAIQKDLFFLPGEAVGTVEDFKKKLNLDKLKIGPGLIIKNENILTAVAGFLSINPSSVMWMMSNPRLYIPKLGDRVIGKILKVRNDHYKVDLGSNTVAFLPTLAFTNATKKVKPDLKVGDLVLAKLCQVDPNINFELTCYDPTVKSYLLGPLSNENSCLIPIDIYLAQKLVMKNTQLSKVLETEIPPDCDIVVGINGFVYISSSSTELTLKIAKLFKNQPND